MLYSFVIVVSQADRRGTLVPEGMQVWMNNYIHIILWYIVT